MKFVKIIMLLLFTASMAYAAGETIEGDLTVTGSFTAGTTIMGDIAVTSVDSSGQVSAGNLTINSGSITDTSGAISFGDENLSTTGTSESGILTEGGNAVPNATNNLSFFAATTSAQLRAILSDESGTGAALFAGGDIGAATGTSLDLSGNLDAGTITIGSGSITDSSGVISFGDENLSTTGTLSAGAATTTSLNNSDGNVTNIGDIAVDSISADAGAGGSIVVNEAGLDVDFRVEGSGSANAFFVQGSNGYVGFGTGTPVGPLTAILGGTVAGTVSGGIAYFVNSANTTDSSVISVVSGNAGFSIVDLADADDKNIGAINYDHSANAMGFRVNDATRITILSSGNTGIGTTTPSKNLTIKASDSSNGIRLEDDDSTDTRVLIALSSGAGRIELYDDSTVQKINLTTTGGDNYITAGNVGIGTTSPATKFAVNGLTSTSSYNLVRVDTADGDFYYDSSTERSKTNIHEMEPNYIKLLGITSVIYTDKTSNITEIGLLAEDLDKADLKSLVIYDQNNKPNGIKYERVSIYLLAMMRNLIWDSLSESNKELIINISKNIWKRQYIRDNTKQIEVNKNDAFESNMKLIDTKEIEKEEIEYVLDNTKITTKKIIIYKQKLVTDGKKLKSNVCFNSQDGKFYRDIPPTQEQVDKALKEKFENEKPEWLKKLNITKK